MQGINGLVPYAHSHGHLCAPDRHNNGYRCILGKGEWALLYFTFQGRKACAFRVSQEGDPPHSDHFKLVRHNDREFAGRCAATPKGQRLFDVFPTH